MAILGTKKFWRPAQGTTSTQRDSQILKNSGYINLQLHCVNYMSVGNFWQNTFGGKDRIALATNLRYESGVESVEATAIQDVREVRVNRNYNLGLQRNLAVKIPANADAIAIGVRMTAVKNDQLQAKFELLNQPDYQKALQLAPTVVGQVLTVTSLAKRLFTDSDPKAQLEASYAGIISSQKESNPVANGKLTGGLLILISTNDGDQFDNVDETKLCLRGDTLYYGNQQVENTYLIFNISFEPFKGDDEKANWFKKYVEALNNLNKVQLVDEAPEREKILSDSKTMWIEGNALIDADASYINSERMRIKGVALKAIKDKYNELTQSMGPSAFRLTGDVVREVIGGHSLSHIREALPVTSDFLEYELEMDPAEPLDSRVLWEVTKDTKLPELLDEDAADYLKDLKKNHVAFKLANL